MAVLSQPEDLTQRLPSEILALVFTHMLLCDDEDPSPRSTGTAASVCASVVCSRWRTIALDYQHLWSQIHLHWSRELAELYYARAGPHIRLSFFFCDEYIRKSPSKGYTGHQSDDIVWNGAGYFPTSCTDEGSDKMHDEESIDQRLVFLHSINSFVEESEPQRALARHIARITPVALLMSPITLSRTRRLHFNMGTSQGHPYGSVGSVAQKVALWRPPPLLESFTLLVAETVVWKASHSGGPLKVDRLRSLKLTKIFLRHSQSYFPPFITSLSLRSVHFAATPDGHRVNLGSLLGGLSHLEALSLVNVTGLGIAEIDPSSPVTLPNLKHFTFHCFVDEVVYILDSIVFPSTATINCGIAKTDFFYHLNNGTTGLQPLYSWALIVASALRRRFHSSSAHFRALSIDPLSPRGGCSFTLSSPSDIALLPQQLTIAFEDARRQYPSYIDVPAFISHVLPLLPSITSIASLTVHPIDDVRSVQSWSSIFTKSPHSAEVISANGLPAAGILTTLLDAEASFPLLSKLFVYALPSSDASFIADSVDKLQRIRPGLKIEVTHPAD